MDFSCLPVYAMYHLLRRYFPIGSPGGLGGGVGASPPRSLFIASGFNLNSKNSSCWKSDFFMIIDLIFIPTLF
jgi:hypothetical protein